MKKLFLSIFLLSLTFYSSAETYSFNDRISVELTAEENLVFKSNYLTYYIAESSLTNAGTLNVFKWRIVAPAEKLIDFPVGCEVKDDYSFDCKFENNPRVYAETSIGLNNFSPSNGHWSNSNVILQGGGLLDVVSKPTQQNYPKLLPVLLFNAVGFANILSDSVKTSNELFGKDNSKYFENLSIVMSSLAEKEEFLSSVTDLLKEGKEHIHAIKYILNVWKKINIVDESNLTVVVDYVEEFESQISALESALGLNLDVSPEKITQSTDRYKKIMATRTGSPINSSVETVLTSAVNKFGVEDSVAFFYEDLGRILTERQKILVLKAKVEYREARGEDQKRRARLKLLLASNMKSFAYLGLIVYNRDYIVNEIKNNPAKVSEYFLSLASTTISYLTSDVNVYEVADLRESLSFARGSTEKFLPALEKKRLIGKVKKINVLFKAVDLGTNIANVAVPYVWDLIFAPSRLSMSLVDKRINIYGSIDSKVTITAVQNGKVISYPEFDESSSNIAVKADPNSKVRVRVQYSQPSIFDPERSPWELGSHLPPMPVVSSVIFEPGRKYYQKMLCAKKLFGDVTFAVHERLLSELTPSAICINGAEGIDDWLTPIDGFLTSEIFHSVSTLPIPYKLAGFSSSGQNSFQDVYFDFADATKDLFVQGLGLGGSFTKKKITIDRFIPNNCGPTTLATAPLDAQVNLSWAALGCAKGYRIYMSTSPGIEPSNPATFAATQIVTASATSFAWGQLINGQKYYFRIEPINTELTVVASSEASATPQKAAKTINVAVEGDGLVRLMNNTLWCGSSCDFAFADGVTVDLTAHPNAGQQFKEWTGACTGTSPTCAVVLTENKNVKAIFEAKIENVTLTVVRNGRGRVVGGGIDCGASCSQAVAPDTRVTLQAQPFSGAKFAGWGGACATAGTASSCTVTLQQSSTVSADFLSPVLVVSPTNLAFGDVAIGAEKTLELVLRNTGNAELTGLAISLNSAEFALKATAPARLAAGAEVKIPVAFTPEAEVVSNAALTVQSTEWQTIEIPLSGKGTAVDLLFRLVPSRTDLKTGETVQLLVDVTSGNPPYRIKVNWGDGNVDEQQTSDSSYTFNHAYSAQGTWPVTVDITDKAERKGSKTLELKVSDSVSGLSRWSAQARHLITDEFTADTPITVANAQIGNDTVQKYQTNWAPKAGSNNEYFVKYRLPVPTGYIKLSNKFRMTVVFAPSNIASYDRELAFVTEKGEFTSSWIHEVDPPIPGYLRFKPFSGAEQVLQSGLLNDDVFRTPIQTYAIEWQGTEFKAQRYKDNQYSPLEKLTATSSSLNELNISFKGNGSIYLVRLDYDLNGNGEYDDGHIIANTADLQVDWQLYKPAPVTVSSGKLNDTGIDWCANANTNNLACPVAEFAGQDGEHGRDALAREGKLQKVGGGAAGYDFTKLDASGNDLPESATAWSCVRDNVTGLIWEVKTTDGGLRDTNHTYTWYNPDMNTNGGFAGIQNGGRCSGSDCDTHAFVQAVNSQGLCGANNWRMPTRKELVSLLNNGRVYPAIDTAYFPHSLGGWSWSSSLSADTSILAWYVDFTSGNVNDDYMGYSNFVRLVRTGQ